jgi:hypothetical protein
MPAVQVRDMMRYISSLSCFIALPAVPCYHKDVCYFSATILLYNRLCVHGGLWSAC